MDEARGDATDLVLIDGPLAMDCPVIAAVTGAVRVLAVTDRGSRSGRIRYDPSLLHWLQNGAPLQEMPASLDILRGLAAETRSRAGGPA